MTLCISTTGLSSSCRSACQFGLETFTLTLYNLLIRFCCYFHSENSRRSLRQSCDGGGREEFESVFTVTFKRTAWKGTGYRCCCFVFGTLILPIRGSTGIFSRTLLSSALPGSPARRTHISRAPTTPYRAAARRRTERTRPFPGQVNERARTVLLFTSIPIESETHLWNASRPRGNLASVWPPGYPAHINTRTRYIGR